MSVYPPRRLSAPSKTDAVVVETPVELAPMASITNRAFGAFGYPDWTRYPIETLLTPGRTRISWTSDEVVPSIPLQLVV